MSGLLPRIEHLMDGIGFIKKNAGLVMIKPAVGVETHNHWSANRERGNRERGSVV